MMRLQTGSARCVWPALLVMVGMAAACASGGGTTTAIATPDAATDGGRFVWHDLVTRDAAASRKFYGDLLGWKFQQTTREGRAYHLATSDGSLVGGIVQLDDNQTGPAAWLSYMAVPDLDRATAQVTAAGGKVLFPPRAVGAFNRVAVVSDPQGAALGLAEVTGKSAPDPAQPPVNQFFWMEHLAKDGPAALAFYKNLGGFESRVTASNHGVDFHVLENQGARAGLYQIPADATMVDPHWLPYVRVADPAAVAARAVALGGTVLMAPRPEVRGGSLAVIADPTGGAIALQRWPI